jgi:hypothetical protein
MDKHGVRAELPSRLQQVDRTQRIHLEVEQRNVARLVVRGLSGAVYDEVERLGSEQMEETLAISDVQVAVPEVLRAGFQPVQIPDRIAALTEERRAKVVVDAHDQLGQTIVVFHGLGANQSAAAGNQNSHAILSLSAVTPHIRAKPISLWAGTSSDVATLTK